MAIKNFLKHKKFSLFAAFILCTFFFVAFGTLSILRHEHYQSFGYDLGINSQVVWRYSLFQPPLTTMDAFPDKTKLATHVEFVYAIISPIYWIWNNSRMLLITQAFFLCFSGIAIYLLAARHKLSGKMSLTLVFSYLLFYGVQHALWFDVHSATFAAAFIAWFLYFVDGKQYKFAWLFLLLSLTAKENIGIITMSIGIVYFILQRDKQTLWMALVSLLYILFIYLIYFPYIVHMTYLYQNHGGLLSNLNPMSMIDSQDKREALFYAAFSFGFLPLLFPILLLPILADFATYFILASDLKASHGIYMHYRVTLAPLLAWSTILVLARYRVLNNAFVALYLILCSLALQYVLHLPLSYLTKSWFWTEPSGVKNIEIIRKQLSPSDALVAQNNIVPHISRRDKIYSLYPEMKEFQKDSPCGQKVCDWFRWDGSPQYLFVDISPEWDTRHLLTDREKFISGIKNLEKKGIIKKKTVSGSATLYDVVSSPRQQ